MRLKFITVILFCFSNSLYSQWMPASSWPVLKRYDSNHLYSISLPVGGIGTGVIGVGGRGELRDWEIMNKPSKGYNTVENDKNKAPFFSIHVKEQGKDAITKGLMGPLHESEYLQYEVSNVILPGIPRFEKASFETAYPFGQVSLSDKELPVKVKLKTFNPLIPGDANSSGIPIAILSYEVENLNNTPIDVSICGNMCNFVGQDGSKYNIDWKGIPIPQGAKNNQNEYRESQYIRGIYMYSNDVKKDDAAWGTIALTTNAKDGVTYRTSSIKDNWLNEAILDFWDDFSTDGVLTEKEQVVDDMPMASLAVKQTIAPRSKQTYTFFVTWNFPNRLGWVEWEKPDHNKTIYGNYYSTLYANAWDVAEKTIPQLPKLEEKTLKFVNSILESSIPDVAKESALFNLSVLRSQTTFRLADGHFLGWEGTMDNTGSCYGSCTHVWNYEQATPFLFGELAMTMRDVELNYATNEIGGMAFRAKLPLNKAALEMNKQNPTRNAAADGQMGCVMKAYREWQLSGDDHFLKKNWPMIKKVLSFAWVEKGWDPNQDGVMESLQHNTMDVGFYGPNPEIGFWYLGALKAASKMASYMKDKEFEKKCNNLYIQGSKWIDNNLFNGEYYIQKITAPTDYTRFIKMDGTESIPPSQLGDCCYVDQLVGQYMASICGLGYLADKENITSSLKSIMKYNYKADFSSHFTNKRSYVAGNESGLLIATWPNGRLKQPFPYFGEVWTGLEYAAASLMIHEGMVDDAEKCIRSVRARFDGAKRNPFDEPECGYHYVRSMSSWAFIISYADFLFSAVDKSMRITSRPGTYFWSNGYAWGTCKVTDRQAELSVLHGNLNLSSFTIKDKGTVNLKNFNITEGESKSIIIK